MKDDDTVDAFIAKLNGYATKAKELGKTLDESLLVRKLLDSTPDIFIQIVASIEQTSDLDDITLDEITGKLKAFEERIKLWKGGQNESQKNLLFAQGEHSGKGRRFDKRGGDASMWYLDNGASNHMTGTKSHFKDIDEGVSGRVRFGDRSYVQIKGRGSILLGCIDQEQKIVSDVYYIPNLKSNILSLGQLTEIGKHSRTPFPNLAKFISKNPLDLVYGDLCGPISPATHSCKKLIFLLVDDCTRFMWAYFLTSKDQAFSTFKEFRQQIEMEMRMKLRMLRTDKGGINNEIDTLVNTDINGDDNNTYQEPDTIPNLVSPITPPTYTYNPHSDEELEATISSIKNSVKGFDHVPVRGFKKLTDIYQNTQEAKTNTLLLTEEEPLNQKAIRLKWVFKTKRDAKGNIIKYKARIVENEYVQEQGIDFDEVFAPVARIETVRSILALAAYHGWQEIDIFKSQMKEKFEMSDLGLLAYYLGIEVKQTGGEITIKQTCYITKILKETSMMDSNDEKIPMDPSTKLVKAEDGNPVDATYYRSLIGSLRYLLHTRPDLSYSVGQLSRFMEDSKDHHLKAVKQKQPTVALSSCESEFMAATAATCQALWLKRLLSELTGCEEKRITLKVDNVSAIALVRNPVFHERSKHIDIRYHFIRECVENGHINVEHISGELQRLYQD
nr:zinc finger, CCHC-type [Tanacetum cinerariifolium]